MLVLSLIAYAQYNTNVQPQIEINFGKETSKEIVAEAVLFETVVEEESEIMEFDTHEYLPPNFNANSKLDVLEYELAIEEEDEIFEFNTEDYLPLGFNAHSNTDLVVYEMMPEETDEAFDFDTKMYLPKGFNPYSNTNTIGAIAQL